MQFPLPFSPIILSCFLLLGFGVSLWWALRDERRSTLAILAGLTVLSAVARLYRILDLPPGLNDDEVKTLYEAGRFLAARTIFEEGLQVPFLHSILFQAPLNYLLDSTFWSMRTYPLTLGTLTVPLIFAACRGMKLKVTPSLVSASITASMPWGLFWSRISSGGEVLFCQALLLVGLTRIIWAGGGWGAVAVATLGLSGLLWDYTAGWVMLALPVVGVLLAPTWRQRGFAISVAIISLVVWIPWLIQVDKWSVYLSWKATAPDPRQLPLESLRVFGERAIRGTLRIFLFPESHVHTLSLHSIAIHPTSVLLTAGLGAILGIIRKSLFVVLGFILGLLPALVTFDGFASSHRVICSYLFIAIACAIPFDLLLKIPLGRWYNAAISLFALCAMGMWWHQGTSLFLSPPFWTESERIFNHATTVAAEQIRMPASEKLIVDGQISRFLEARHPSSHNYRVLAYDNWMPTPGTEHVISSYYTDLIASYLAAMPADQITLFGEPHEPRALRARFDETVAARWALFGWVVERTCASRPSTPVRIPLFMYHASFGWSFGCDNPGPHIFTSTWVGPTQEFILKLSGPLPVSLKSSRGLSESYNVSEPSAMKFTLHTDEEIVISVTPANGNYAALHVMTATGAMPPPAELFKPTRNN